MDADTPDMQAMEATDSRRLCMRGSDVAPALPPFKINGPYSSTLVNVRGLACCEQIKNIPRMQIQKFFEPRPLCRSRTRAALEAMRAMSSFDLPRNASRSVKGISKQ